MKLAPFRLATQGSFKRQIILTFAVGFFFLIAAFTAYQVKTESAYLYRDSSDETISLAESLAASSRSWVLANDVVGLQEVVHSFQSHPELRYVMVISPRGRVLAHSDATKIGQFVSDEASVALIRTTPHNRIMIDDESIIDIAVPITIENRLIGWARIAQGREDIGGYLHKMILSSALFVLMAVTLSLLAALFIANRLGLRIGYLMRVAEAVQSGNYATRANITGADEIARMANSFNHMLDVLAHDEEQLRAASLYTRSLIEASLDPLVTISMEGKITDVNQATEKATGRSRSELIGTDFSNYFTKPDKAREGYQQVFAQGYVTDYPLALRHFDGHIIDVLYNASVYRDEAGKILGVFAAARDVTERNKAEAALRENEALLQTTMKILPVGLWVLGADGKIVFSNDAAQQVWAGVRYVGIEQLGEHKGWRIDNGKPIGPHEWAGSRALEKGETTIEDEIEIECFDGTRKIILDSAVPLRGSDGSIRGAITVNHDITERKRAEETIRESQARFSTIFNQAPLGIALIDSNTGKIYEVNPRFAEIAGRAIEEMLTIDWMSITHPDDVQEDLDNMALLNAGKISGFRMDKRYMRPDGSFVWINMTIAPLRGDQNLSPRHLCMIEDITERKKAENALREKDERLALATINNGVGIWDWNLRTQEMIWDDSMYALYHIRREDFSGTEEAWRAALHPDDLARGDQEVADAISGKKPFETDFRVVWPNGEIHYIKAVAKVFRDNQGTPLRMLGINMDVTERKQSEEKIRQLNNELEQRVIARTAELEAANKELESFSYSVSHDLRTPLRAIDGFSNILLEDYTDKLDDEGRRLLDVVRDNTVRMGQLIDDILKFSRAGRLELNSTQIDMEQLAREVYEELRPAAGHELQIEIGHLPSAMGDRAMMRQVFVNLLSNAIKFTGAREDAKIEVGSSAAGNETVYFAKDNGAGFDMRYVDRLFGVFQRLHGENEFAGTGIGLAIVKRIITRHGGRVWAEGKVNQGATIYFALPAGNAATGSSPC